MKHLILVFSLIFSVCVFSYAMGISASDGPVASVFEQTETENPLDGIFETFFALAAFIPIAFQFLRKLLLPNAGGIGVQILSWVIGLAITMGGWFLKLGFLDGLSVWMALLYGAGACLAANGIFDTGLITAIFNALFGLFGSKK
jgi:hypothetical protein